MPRNLLLVLMLYGMEAYSQVTITGKVVDTGGNRSLHNAVISAIDTKDSILLRFTRSAQDGSFRLTNVPSQDFFLLISFPGYADYLEQIKKSDSTNLGIVALTKKSELLEAVIVQRRLAAIRMRGDTLAFLADSFSVRQGATVDELLKQLPGIQVDRNGAITAHGEKVNKVLVDGEEFFSDDPAVVIKNLQAEAVKEVQVFDKKSEQAEFTGIDDGERSKTINLTLKPEKKRGYFGRASLFGGTNGSFDNDLMANYFKGTRKIAVFGIASNIGRQGLNWNEMERFGGGNNIEYNEEEGYFTSTSGDDEFSRDMNYEDGLPAAWSGGFHFSDKWRNERKKVNGNYRFLKKNLNTEGTTRTQYILPDTQYFSDLSRKVFNSRIGHQLSGVYEIKFDSLSDVKITVNGANVRNEMASMLESRALNADSGLVNENSRLLTSLTENRSLNTNVLLRKRFKTKGRTLSVNVQQQAQENQLDGLLQSTTGYYNSTGEISQTEVIDQKKDNGRNSMGVRSNAVYTEPLSKSLFLSVNYGFDYLQTEASRNSFNKGLADVYDKRDSLLSSDFKFRYTIQSMGADVKLNRKKLMIVVGSGLNFSDYRQTDLRRDSSSSYTFTNFFPKVLLKITPRPYSNFTIRYNGRNNPPTLDQLQPVRENTDPLNVQVGNPSLRQEFVHTANLTFHTYQVISEKGLYLMGYGTFTENAISTSSIVDKGGKTTFMPVNVDGNYMANIYGGYNMKLKKSGIYMNAGVSVNLNRMSNFVNGLKNVNSFRTHSLNMYISKFKKDKYSVTLRPAIGYTFSKSSLRPDITTKFITSESGADFWVKLPLQLELWSEARFLLRGKTDVFDVNRNVVKWDASLARKFLKNNNLEVKVVVYDLLNQNIGFNRSVNSNFISENSFVTLRRRCLIGLQYNISKNP